LKELLATEAATSITCSVIIEDDKQLSQRMRSMSSTLAAFDSAQVQGRPMVAQHVWIGEASEVNEVHISAEFFGHGVACGDGDGRLADATGPSKVTKRSARRLSMTSVSICSRRHPARRAGNGPWYRKWRCRPHRASPADSPTNE